MRKNLFIVLIVLVVVAVLIQFQGKSEIKSPSQSLEENVSKLRAGGEITAEQESLVKLQLAIVDYIAVKHSPPESLNLLVPKYFKSVPINPLTKKPFQYEKKGDSYDILDAGGVGATENQSESKKPAEGEPKVGASPGAEYLNPNNLAIEDFAYSPEGKRDPFKPFDLAPKISLDENLPPLERYDLSQLKVSAILSDAIGGMVAIVEDATGKGYTVKVGTRVGDKNGTVVSIDSSQVNVLEKVKNFTGEEKQDLRSIKLQKAPEGNKKPSKASR